MFNLFKSAQQQIDDEIIATKKLLSDIVDHAKNSSRQFGLNDLIAYKNRFIQLSRSNTHMTALYVGEINEDVRCMSHLIQLTIQIHELLDTKDLSSEERKTFVNYKESYHDLENNY
jgi:poly(A) polymerase Pap1